MYFAKKWPRQTLLKEMTRWMISKQKLADVLLLIVLLYIASPWVLERTFFLNEVISATGLCLFVFKRLKIAQTGITIAILLLLFWGAIHCITSLFRMDTVYVYLRNTVIIYSIFAYFAGYFTQKYLSSFIDRYIHLLRAYTIFFLAFPNTLFFERFGMATIFPALLKRPPNLILLILFTAIYALVYSSSTIGILTAFYIFIAACPGFKAFKWISFMALMCFTGLFIYLLPYLNLIKYYDPYHYDTILKVMDAHPILSMDHNNSWRLIFWKQVLIDHFPDNIPGVGLGTPLIQYFPVEDFSKFDTLPYVFGAHNSFIYLFGRLGLPYAFFTFYIYHIIFREYFLHKQYYYSSNGILYFWSFFAISIITLFNPVLESPIFASLYWFLLGLLASIIYNRTQKVKSNAATA